MLRWGVVAACAAAACVESRGVPCGDTGLICAEGTVCRELTPSAGQPVENRCMQPAQLDACAGHVVGDACDAVAGGRCYPRLLAPDDAASDELVCLAVGCGNGRVDEDQREQCDDTNAVNGDGCSASCLSNETCGNGIVDAYAHRGIDDAPSSPEQCDDHNARANDGCSAACVLEAPIWSRVETGIPAPRLAASLVGTGRGRVVLFGGASDDGTAFDDTWEWDGRGWINRIPTFHPAARARAASTYDPVRHRVVMFGGLADESVWEWDGTRWTAAAPPERPEMRFGAAMGYDRAHGRVVMFGGDGNEGPREAETWEWDGAAWTSFTQAGTIIDDPDVVPAQSGHAMAYDPVRDKLVLVGVTANKDTGVWEYEGAGVWSARALGATAPPARTDSALAYDPQLGALVLSGGVPPGADPTTSALEDAWTWDGATWAEVCGACGAPRSQHGMAYDATRGLVMFGGAAPASGPSSLDTLAATNELDAWDSGWTHIDVFDPDAPKFATWRRKHVVALDPLRARMITWGGGHDTAALSTSGWSALPAAPVSPRDHASLVYDPVDRVHVLFGGFDPVTGLDAGDTFTFDGAIWTAVAAGPTARDQHAAAWLADRMVMFGGWSGGAVQGDLWTWSLGTWTQVQATGAWPAKRAGAVMALDPVRQRIVMFGGASDEQPLLNDTWEWDGAAWTRIETPARPQERTRAAMAWDPATGQLLLFGGIGSSGVVFDDVWAYDGVSWRQLEIAGGPSARGDHTLVTSPDGKGVLLYGGVVLGQSSPELWRLRWDSHTTVESCTGFDDGDGDGAKGCADDECWAVCAPLCPPPPPNTSTAATTCTAEPRCGDHVCSELESCRSCPDDCDACTPVCGDLVCDADETCPGDCP